MMEKLFTIVFMYFLPRETCLAYQLFTSSVEKGRFFFLKRWNVPKCQCKSYVLLWTIIYDKYFLSVIHRRKEYSNVNIVVSQDIDERTTTTLTDILATI